MRTHDYTDRGWGHDFAILTILREGLVLLAMGWGRGIDQGDYMILPNKEATTRYKVSAIKYCYDPPDMWRATLEFAPRN